MSPKLTAKIKVDRPEGRIAEQTEAPAARSTATEFEEVNQRVKEILERIDRQEPITRKDADDLMNWGYLLRTIISEEQQARQYIARLQGIRAKAATGAYLGGNLPFGFRWNKADQAWDLEPTEHPILLELMQLHNAGRSYNWIAAELSRRGVPPPKGGQRGYANTVRRILLSDSRDRLRP